ncbi:Sin3 family co-repressor-domain-containing protein [Gongronella butleri]|nr:Sin3 family co-repressor-domain-containing protein [Gongronella butleri]
MPFTRKRKTRADDGQQQKRVRSEDEGLVAVGVSDVRTTLHTYPLNEESIQERVIGAREQLHCAPLEVTSVWKALHSASPPLIMRIHAHIGHQEPFSEFLAIIDLYCDQIIDMKALCKHARPFLANHPSLYDLFCKAIKAHCLPDERTSSSQTHAADGPSYRHIPGDAQQRPCKGRDQMCWDVLNDEYVSHPQWASEDGSFLSSKKNVYEERLQHVEDERYELDIELTNLQAASILLQEYRDAYRDTPATQHIPSSATDALVKFIPLIRRVAREHRHDNILVLLRRNTRNTLIDSIVRALDMRRQDIKDQKKERNKGWSDMVKKNYYKALDYQSVHNRGNLQPPSSQVLLTEIAMLCAEQQHLRQHHLAPEAAELPYSRLLPPAQFEFTLDDRQDTLEDLLKLLRVSSKHDYQFKSEKHSRDMARVLYHWLPKAMGFAATTTDPRSQPPRKRDTRAVSPAAASASATASTLPATNALPIPPKLTKVRSKTRAVINAPFYCMLRYTMILFDALRELRIWSERFLKNPGATRVALATPAKLDEVMFPIPVKIEPKVDHYELLLAVITSHLQGHIDQVNMEEAARHLFGIKGYLVFYIDRLLHSIIKQANSFLQSPMHEELQELFDKHAHSKGADVYLRSVDTPEFAEEHLFMVVVKPHHLKFTIHTLQQEKHAPSRPFLARNLSCSTRGKDEFYAHDGIVAQPVEEDGTIVYDADSEDVFVRACSGQ